MFSVLFSFLGVGIITFAATTISTNINTGGTLTVSGSATSTFSTGGFTVGTSQFVVQQTSGNVGIGTTSPFAKLSVHANAIENNLNLFAIASSTASATTTHFIITNKGVVLVGSTASDVDVSGTKLIVSQADTGFTASFPMGIYGEAASDGIYQARGIMGSAKSSGTQHASGIFGYATDGGSSDTGNVAGVTAYVNAGHAGNTIGFWVANVAGGVNNYSFRGDAGTLYNAGNVGIGTTTPNRPLNIAANAGPQFLLTQPGAGTDLKHWYASTTAGSLTVGTLNDSLLTLTERLRIDNLGRLGIGTTTPTASFQVATSTANATTTMEVGKANQNKGSCLKLYDDVGAVYYCRITGGTFTCNTTSCE